MDDSKRDVLREVVRAGEVTVEEITEEKKIIEGDKRGLVGIIATVDYLGNVQIPANILSVAGITLPKNKNELIEVELSGAEQGVQVRTTQERCAQCRSNHRLHKYLDGRMVCRRCFDQLDQMRRMMGHMNRQMWLSMLLMSMTNQEMQTYTMLRNSLPPWTIDGELFEKELTIGRVLTYVELEDFTKEVQRNVR